MTQRYKFVVFDLDGVIADYPSSWGYVHAHFGETNEANVNAYFSGEIDDHEFMRRDISIWKGYKPDITLNEVTGILDEIPLIPGAVETLRELKKNDIKLAILSGGLEPLARRVASMIEIDHVFANGLSAGPDGKLGDEGILNVPLMEKERVMLRLMDDLDLNRMECAAVGDSMVDAGMLKLAGLGIAFCPMDKNLLPVADVVITNKNLQEILRYIL